MHEFLVYSSFYKNRNPLKVYLETTLGALKCTMQLKVLKLQRCLWFGTSQYYFSAQRGNKDDDNEYGVLNFRFEMVYLEILNYIVCAKGKVV